MHQKHPKLKRTTIGSFAKVEIGLFGAVCSEIKEIARSQAEQFKAISAIYVDASHTALDNPDFSNRISPHFKAELTDEQGQFTLSSENPIMAFENNPGFEFAHHFDLALINANHFTPPATVLIWREDRLAKIIKRKAQLQACIAVVGANAEELPAEVLEALPKGVHFIGLTAGWSKELAEFICSKVPVAPLKGLVLAGGKSTRMGKDKTRIDFHGKPQYHYVSDLLSEVTEAHYLSVQNSNDFPDVDNCLVDRLTGMGPFGAILTAFMHDPDAAWLVVATDLPKLDRVFLDELISQRAPERLATAFFNPETGFPDPLCTIWEPRAYRRMLTFMSRGYSCPRKVLINSDIALIESEQSYKLANVNTPEDLRQI